MIPVKLTLIQIDSFHGCHYFIITSPGLALLVFMNVCGKFFNFSMEILNPMNEFVAAAVAVATIKFYEIIIRKWMEKDETTTGNRALIAFQDQRNYEAITSSSSSSSL